MKRRILITGGLGYLGGRIARHLARTTSEQGDELLVGTRKRGLQRPEWLASGNLVHFDLLSADLSSVCREVDVIVHLAAVNEIESAASPVTALRVNAEGTLNLLIAAVKAGIKRFIYLSTAHVYGAPLSGRITERTLPQPVHPYAITHRAAEDFVLAEHARHAIEGVVIRLSNGFGAPERADVDRWSLLINDLCRQAATKHLLTLKSSGLQQRDFITLHDVARAVQHVIDLPAALLDDGLFNLGGQNVMTVYAVACLIRERCRLVLGFQPEISRPEVIVEETSASLVYDIEKLMATGFHLTGDMRAEIDDTLRLCRSAFAEAIP